MATTLRGEWLKSQKGFGGIAAREQVWSLIMYYGVPVSRYDTNNEPRRATVELSVFDQ